MTRFRFVILTFAFLSTLSASATQAKAVNIHAFIPSNAEPVISSDDSAPESNDLFRRNAKRVPFKSISKTAGKSFSPVRVLLDDDDDESTESATLSSLCSGLTLYSFTVLRSVDWLDTSFARRSKNLRR